MIKRLGQAMAILSLGFGLTACSTLPPALSFRDALSPQEHVTLGMSYQRQGSIAPAIEQYQAALRTDKRFVPALIALGNVAFEQKEWTQAEKYFRKALKQVPDDPTANNNLAMVYLNEGKLNEAEIYARKALAQPGPVQVYAQDTLSQIKKVYREAQP